MVIQVWEKEDGKVWIMIDNKVMISGIPSFKGDSDGIESIIIQNAGVQIIPNTEDTVIFTKKDDNPQK